MTKTLCAIFDGRVLCPEEPLALEPNTHVRVKIEAVVGKPDSKGCSFFQTARSLRLRGPVNWSANLEDYLYGFQAVLRVK